MQRLPRSPPTSSHTYSDTDISKLDEYAGLQPFVSQRNKRRRDSCEELLSSFKDEMKQMLSEMKELIMNKLIADIAEIKDQNSKIQQTNLEIEKSMDLLSAQYDNINTRIDFLEKERKEHILHISTLETKLEEIQRNLKSASIEIRNLPLDPKNEHKPDLAKIVMNTCKALNANVQDSDIKEVYQIRGKSGKCTIIADFTRTTLKQDLVRKAKDFNKKHPTQRLCTTHLGFEGVPTPIYVSEALTGKGRRLLYLARDFASANGYKYCWTSNGKVFIRKTDSAPHMEIKNESDLTSLRNAQ